MRLRYIFALTVAFISSVNADEDYKKIEPFLQKYCIECHGADKQKGDIRLDHFDKIDAELWINVHEQMSDGEMPPEDELQPSQEEFAAMKQYIDRISRDEKYTIASGFRRMNKREYRNTVRDLLGLRDDSFDPAYFIFEDEVEHGFDTNSENLTITNELLLEYLRSATVSLQVALFPVGERAPTKREASFKNKQFKVDGQLSGVTNKIAISKTSQGAIYPKNVDEVITVPGRYRVTAVAAGLNRLPKNYRGASPQPGVPYRMVLGTSFKGVKKKFHEFVIKDDVYESFSGEVWLDPGAVPYFNFSNGSKKPRILNRHANTPKPVPIPALGIKEIKIEGPLDVEWPPHTYKTTFQTKVMPDLENASVRMEILQNFICRAFRRVATQEEVNRYMDYLKIQHKKRGSWHEAFIRTMAAVMASTDFLYIKEDAGKLGGFQLANRLSYMLWSTMPDMELFKLANSGELLKEDVYIAQIKRMIKDPRSQRFVDSFVGQWLSLDELGDMRPSEDDNSYNIYYKLKLESAMRKETQLYFRHILFNNLPVTDFLDSDYTFLNKNLAKLYDVPFDGGDEFKLTKLPANSVRGGLLGHASIHAITSNGVETLPVTRGHWVLDELMGTPPPPPPQEVPAIVPDLTHVNSPRKLLEAHSKDEKCFGCHKLMDPPGVALESFDIIGRYRQKYSKKSKIETSGEFMGTKFEDVRGLRKALMNQKDLFTLNFAEKIAEYAKGRQLNRKDLDLVMKIAKESKEDDYKFLHLVADIFKSDLMLHR